MYNWKKSVLFVFISLQTFQLFATDVDLLYLGFGENNFRRRKSKTTEFRAEYKFHYKWWVFNPLLGVSITTKKQVYAYGGISLELFPSKYFVIAPNFAAGYYNKGDGKDLGFPLEFRTGIEAAIVFKNKMRIGGHISHTSNASIGRKNPGLETWIIFLTIPITKS